MGFGLKKIVGKITGKGGSSSSGGGFLSMAKQAAEQMNVANGNGRMINGQYVAYSAADKAHVQSADANRNAQYTDISTGSQLGYYFGEATQLGQYSKRRAEMDARRQTLLGGFSPLGA